MKVRIAAILLIATSVIANAQDDPAIGQANGIKLDKQLVQRWKVGMSITAPAGPCAGVFGTATIPTDWPEQQVRLLEEDLSPEVKDLAYRTLDNGVKQMLISIPMLNAGQEAHAYVTVEVIRSSILGPDDPLQFEIPKRVPRDVVKFLAPSPFIESRHAKIRSLAREILKEKEDAPAWEQVEAMYDWVRENVEYVNGPLKGAIAALNDGNGDCEELTSLFIALCRANKIPARTVWIPQHCYPEFYLEDKEGKGHWFPCQAAGTRDFGSMPDHRPILQKGDNYRVPEKKEPQRYVAEFLKVQAIRGGGKPQVQFVRQLLDGQ
ncbi:MAG: transglutaminase family protein [Planctomycetaceae bacterium]|nr:transglutaminase family protein [Planctomycetales bacterium]MCB9922121.1 transglutaminase family protein [Planctomycetaceae bacterium]